MEIYRNPMEIFWKSYGNPMEILGKSCGDPMEILWKSYLIFVMLFPFHCLTRFKGKSFVFTRHLAFENIAPVDKPEVKVVKNVQLSQNQKTRL